MKIIAQTIFMPPTVVYDTAAPTSDTGNKIKNMMQPVVKVVAADGNEVYSTGEFYKPTGFYIAMLVLGLSAGYIAYKAVK